MFGDSASQAPLRLDEKGGRSIQLQHEGSTDTAASVDHEVFVAAAIEKKPKGKS